MARKSRKNLLEQSENELGKLSRVAVYLRISVEDKNGLDSSIENQRQIIEKFVSTNVDLEITNEFIDNGISGRNFDRAGFKSMIEEVEKGNIDCIIVKDLSRLGRNVIDTGYYIEKFFPTHNVRFIAVNDNFDTLHNEKGTIILPIKNMINEAYSMDISKKVKGQARQAMLQGDYIGGRAPYGYRKDKANCHKLVVDEEVAPIVKQIFKWAKDGKSINEITRNLNDKGYLSPGYLKQNRGELTNEKLIGKGIWRSNAVKKILLNEVYVGDMVQGKTIKVNGKHKPVPESEWIRVENTHEAIVDKEIFAFVKEKSNYEKEKFKSREKSNNEKNIYKSKLICGCCGEKLQKNYNSYTCRSRNKYSKNYCTGVTINKEIIFSEIIYQAKEQIIKLEKQKEEYEKNINKFNTEDKNKLITELGNAIEDDRGYLKSLYESLVNGVIEETDYFNLRKIYEGRIVGNINRFSDLKSEETTLREINLEIEKYKAELGVIKKAGIITESFMENYIKECIVHEDKRVEILFNFSEKFELLTKEM